MGWPEEGEEEGMDREITRHRKVVAAQDGKGEPGGFRRS